MYDVHVESFLKKCKQETVLPLILGVWYALDTRN